MGWPGCRLAAGPPRTHSAAGENTHKCSKSSVSEGCPGVSNAFCERASEPPRVSPNRNSGLEICHRPPISSWIHPSSSWLFPIVVAPKAGKESCNPNRFGQLPGWAGHVELPKEGGVQEVRSREACSAKIPRLPSASTAGAATTACCCSRPASQPLHCTPP